MHIHNDLIAVTSSVQLEKSNAILASLCTIYVTVLVLHLYHGILMSNFITQMKMSIRMTLRRCNHQYDHDVLNVFWSVKAENLAYE